MTPDNPFAPSNTAPPEFDANELRAPGTICFRLRKQYWIGAFTCAAFGAYLLVLPVLSAAISDRQDTIAIVKWAFLTAILSLFPIAWFVRVRLWFTPNSIVYRGLTTQAILNADIHHIAWRINRIGARIEVHGPSRLINIRLESFEWKDQNAMVAAIRHAFPMDIQSGWNEAFEMRLDYAERG